MTKDSNSLSCIIHLESVYGPIVLLPRIALLPKFDHLIPKNVATFTEDELNLVPRIPKMTLQKIMLIKAAYPRSRIISHS
jgi:hypothetical protein